MLISLLTLIGSLGLFLFAMQLISESLQKIAGDHLRHTQASMTRSTFRGMAVGLGVTAFVQSSLVTTMMTVSFVNAGIITLSQSMAVIMGANIGTTITAWLIALLGFQTEAISWAFPLIAIALPLFSLRRGTANSLGEMLLGYALFILSMDTLETAFAGLSSPFTADFLLADTQTYIIQCTLLLISGLLFTIVARSSSAAFLMSLMMCIRGWIPFEVACYLIIMANIGTCIPAYWASRRGNTMARRAAIGHLLFNVTGMLWATLFLLFALPWFTQFYLIIGLGNANTPEAAPLCLALFHTSFNMITMCLLLPFTHKLAKGMTRFVPERKNSDESFKLQYITTDLLSSPGEMALVQVQKEASTYAADTYQMFTLIREMVREPMGSLRQHELMNRMKQMEEESDNAELEIAQFLNQISPQTLSTSGEQLSRNLYKVVDELESIADSLYHCSKTLGQKSEQLIRFTPKMNEDLAHMLDLTDSAMQHMTHVLSLDEVPANALNRAYNFEDEINNLRNQLRNQMLDAMERKEVEFQQHTFFMFLINECEKIGDYVINVIAAASM